jgi:ribulose-5-phosphate 4-epimerase/fuculose-1-phosphate aldolase
MAGSGLQVVEDRKTLDHAEERRALAAAFRWAARFGFNEGVANHFSLAVSEDGRQFLINPFARHFARLRANDLLLLDAETSAVEAEARRVDPTAWAIHAPIHRLLPQARCILHTHMKHATILSCLQDARLPPIDQNTMRFHDKVALDVDFEGMAMTEAEGERLAGVLGDKTVLLMGNHGVMVVGPSVAQAFDDLYYFEKACETLIGAYSTGKELRVVSETVARRTAAEWETFTDMADHHFAELMAMLDDEEPDYRS